MHRKILCIVQARMSSTRLQGKVLREVMGRPLISYMIERLRPSKLVTEFVVATSHDVSDDPIAAWCRQENVSCFRGSLNDVLDRFYQCATSRAERPEIIIRLTADCPLHHFAVLDFALDRYMQQNLEYFTNAVQTEGEDGFDVEVFSFQALEQAWKIRKGDFDKEHVTPLIRHREDLKRGFEKYCNRYHFHLSVDYPDDFELIRTILEGLYSKNHLFSIEDVVDFTSVPNSSIKLTSKQTATA